jgi:hypothetical protein
MTRESEISIIPKTLRVFYDVFADLPTTGVKEGELGYATERRVLYTWDGTAWQPMSVGSLADVIGDRPAAADMPEGSLFYATDTGVLFQKQGAAWEVITPAAFYSESNTLADITHITADWTSVAAASVHTILNRASATRILGGWAHTNSSSYMVLRFTIDGAARQDFAPITWLPESTDRGMWYIPPMLATTSILIEMQNTHTLIPFSFSIDLTHRL